MTEQERIELERDYRAYEAQGRIWGQVGMDRIRKIRFPRLERAIIEQFLALPDLTTGVADALDRRGIQGAVAASQLQPLLMGRKIVGQAVTLRSLPERHTPTQGYAGQRPARMSTRDIYSLAEPGDVVVADFGGDPDVSNFGGQSALAAKRHGMAGAIVHGAVRDAATLREIDYPVWATGVTPVSGKHRMQAMEINGPVRLVHVLVEAGDLIVADDSGVCVVPAELAEAVLREAQLTADKEARVRELLRSGADLATLRSHYRK